MRRDVGGGRPTPKPSPPVARINLGRPGRLSIDLVDILDFGALGRICCSFRGPGTPGLTKRRILPAIGRGSREDR